MDKCRNALENKKSNINKQKQYNDNMNLEEVNTINIIYISIILYSYRDKEQ